MEMGFRYRETRFLLRYTKLQYYVEAMLLSKKQIIANSQVVGDGKARITNSTSFFVSFVGMVHSSAKIFSYMNVRNKLPSQVRCQSNLKVIVHLI